MSNQEVTVKSRCGPDWLHDKIAAGKHVLIDGAMGTELEARGVPMHEKAWSGAALLSHPDVAREIHADYIAAGAEVIITNTFATGRHMLDRAGLGDEVAGINRTAVELARQARDEAATHPVAIAGSMCEWVDSKSEWADPERASMSFREQAALLVEAGVDLIAIEMCSHPGYAQSITEAAVATGLPVWVGMSCRRNRDSNEIEGFDPPHVLFDQVVKLIGQCQIGVINIMHSAIADTAAGLSVVNRHWSGPLGVYPESGHFVMPNWQFVDIIEPADFVSETHAWMQCGAQIIGGCCGLGVAHIRALKQAFG